MMGAFDSAMSTLIDVMHAADGKTITVHAPTGDVELVAMFRRTPREWQTGDGSVSGGHWQLVCKSSAVAALPCDSPRGLKVSVDSADYTILREVREDGGVSVLELGIG